MSKTIQVQAAVTAHSRELASILKVLETQQPGSVEQRASLVALFEMAKQFGMGLRQIFESGPTEVERDEISTIVQVVPLQLVRAPALNTASPWNHPQALTPWELQEIVKRHFRVVLSVLYWRDPKHIDRCWRCWHHGVSAIEHDRCAICTWVICPQCGAGGISCPQCTSGRIHVPQPLIARLA